MCMSVCFMFAVQVSDFPSLIQRMDSSVSKVHFQLDITGDDYLPFFFHQYEKALGVIQKEFDDNEEVNPYERAAKLSSDVAKALSSFLVEYHGFIRRTQYGFASFFAFVCVCVCVCVYV